MILGYDLINDSNSITPATNKVYADTIKVENGIFNHLNILNIISLSNGIFSTIIPENWDNNTLLNATFNGNINGGSLSTLITSIDHLEIQKKEQDSDEWITLQKIYKNLSTNELLSTFTMFDTYSKNDTIYTYRVIPVDNNGNYGFGIEQDVLSRFNDAYIADSNNIYNITDNYTLSNVNINQQNAQYLPFASKYPFVAYNAETNFESGTLTAILLCPTTDSPYIDRMAQTKKIKEFNDWLNNKKPKILKDFNGRLKIITIVDSIANNYYEYLGNGLASSSFNYYEIGEFTQEFLDNLGMTNNFKLN